VSLVDTDSRRFSPLQIRATEETLGSVEVGEVFSDIKEKIQAMLGGKKQGVIINMESASGLYPMLPDPIYSGSKVHLWHCMVDCRFILVLLARVVHTLSHNFRSATSIVRTLLKLPIEPHHVLVKIIYAGVNASDVNFSSGRYFGGSDQELSSRLPCDLVLRLFVHMYQELAFSLRRIYHYDESAQTKFQKEKPWTNDPHYFKRVKILALALLKMVVHARSGENIEIMGLMQGKADGDAIIVMDAFALPVETRVNSQADAYEYMVDYSQTNKQAGQLENVVGWYHSHPGYGCWLFGIDVSTQMLNQQFQEPFLAVVIDPTRIKFTFRKVEIGAFRTYPEGYKPPDEPVLEYQTIPLNKIEDFGVHCKQVYLFISFSKFIVIFFL
ncbi:hypothetical protein IFM89_031355, partial [Coptis chinensis]